MATGTDRKIEAVKIWILDALSAYKPSIFHEALTGSVYIKFPHWGLGSIRIGDHPKIRKYAYKWQVRVDVEDWVDQNPNPISKVFGTNQLEELVGQFMMNAEARDIQPGDAQTWEEFKGLPKNHRKDAKIERGFAKAERLANKSQPLQESR